MTTIPDWRATRDALTSTLTSAQMSASERTAGQAILADLTAAGEAADAGIPTVDTGVPGAARLQAIRRAGAWVVEMKKIFEWAQRGALCGAEAIEYFPEWTPYLYELRWPPGSPWATFPFSSVDWSTFETSDFPEYDFDTFPTPPAPTYVAQLAGRLDHLFSQGAEVATNPYIQSVSVPAAAALKRHRTAPHHVPPPGSATIGALTAPQQTLLDTLTAQIALAEDFTECFEEHA